MMAERQIAYDRNVAGGEKFVQQRLDFGVAPAPFQLPDDHSSDFFQSTGQPEVGQHTVDAIERLVDVFEEPDAVVDPEIVRRAGERGRQRQASSEQNALRFAIEDDLLRSEMMRERRVAAEHRPEPLLDAG